MSVIAVPLDHKTRPSKGGRRLLWILFILFLALLACIAVSGHYKRFKAENETAHNLAPLVDYRDIYKNGRDREANDLLLKSVAVLIDADSKGVDLDSVFAKCAAKNSTPGKYAELLADSLHRNLKIARQLGCDTRANVERMKSGTSPIVTIGPYAGEKAEVDHIVPRSLAPDLDNLLINLELMPRTLNRKKSNRVTPRAFSFAEKFLRAGVIDSESFAIVEAAKER